MNRNQLLLIGGAVVVVLFYLFRNQGALGAANPVLQPQNRLSIIPSAGPNTPINTSGSAPYAAGGAYGAGSSRVGTVGPSASAASSSGLAGLANTIASLLKGDATPSGTLAAGYPANQAPYSVLNAPPQNPITPPAQPLQQAINAPYDPVSPASLTTFDAPPDIASPSLTPTINLSALATAPPSPIGAPSDFGSAIDAAITNPSYYTQPTAISADYASPSYVYDGGEVTASTG